MNASQDERLERFFSKLCAGQPAHRMPKDAWPAVAGRLPDGPVRRSAPGASFAARPLWVSAGAALAVLAALLWTHPGAAADVVSRIRRMLSGTFEFRIENSAPVKKEVAVESGKPARIDLGDHEVVFTMTEMDNASVKTTIRVSKKTPDGVGKVLLQPSVLTRKGTRAEVTVTDGSGKKPLFRIQVIPTDAPDKVIGSVREAK